MTKSKSYEGVAHAIFDTKIAVYDKEAVALNVGGALGLEGDELATFVLVCHKDGASFQDGVLTYR